ncbi:class I tRNA ligase family protein [uncultured Clostridium sp.]|uniref:methionine--tRNA ligase n=1 Tax=uncultured Clostridium sp. TaxID=59620 RepID=UPI00260A2937|nr:class I tRNA ligase family protein [uncultured Clostridium sp.]
MKVIIGNAWPYANSKLHLGRVVVFIPGDILARYHRKKGDEVIFISGSDAHGNLILSKAEEEKITPIEVVEKYHGEFIREFEALDFSFDLFSNTEKEFHKEWVQTKIKELYDKDYIYENEGDLFFKLSKFENEVKNIFERGEFWRKNAKIITEKYIREGLRDRAVTKDIDFGVKVPLDGFDDKRIFVWIEALMGYLTAAKECIGSEESLKEYFNGGDSRVYLIHGKDNIPFHTIIFTGLISALGYDDINLRVFSSNYLKLEGKNFSTIKNWALWIDEVLEKYSVDLIRYFLIMNSPEECDTDFRWKSFISSNNELVDELERFCTNTVNLYNKERCQIYKNKYEKNKMDEYYEDVGLLIEKGKFKDGLKLILSFVKETNRDKTYSIIKLINIANLLEPFMPSFSHKILDIFKLKNNSFEFIHIENVDRNIEYIETFRVMDKNIFIDEINNLKKKKLK